MDDPKEFGKNFVIEEDKKRNAITITRIGEVEHNSIIECIMKYGKNTESKEQCISSVQNEVKKLKKVRHLI
ncbi:MAG: hypothetical protein WC934_04850 [Acidithiobacillus sp.]|jgi:hypothetical protein|uniref:hypothetical protein n=1 Tax=Acidithiobacillus sp. TaxID=1872118 RepID=UPI00355FD37A